MRKDAKPIDYVTKDYEGFRNLMIEKIPQHAPEWTDHSQSDQGIAIIELLSYGLDVLSYYQDKGLNERVLSKAKSRKSVIESCRLVGYELGHQTPARHKIRIIKQEEYLDSNVVLPKGYPIGTDSTNEGQVAFELESDVVLKAGQREGYAYAVHGVTIEEDIIGTSDGSKEQEYKLTFPDALVDTLAIYVLENGARRKWEKVEDFLSSTGDSRHYKVVTNELNESSIVFGTGVTGKIPQVHSNIVATYRVGGGTVGNVGINTITELLGMEIIGVDSITNPEPPASLGTDVEDIEHAKVHAPRSFRTNERAVTRQDFEDLAQSYPSIAKAKAVETFNANNDMLVYIANKSYTEPSQELKDALKAFLEERAIANTNVIIKVITIVEYDIDIQPIVHENYVNQTIDEKALATLAYKLDVDYMECGEDVPLAQIINTCMSIEGVKNVIINKPTTSVAIDDTELAKPRNIVVKTTGGVDMDA